MYWRRCSQNSAATKPFPNERGRILPSNQEPDPSEPSDDFGASTSDLRVDGLAPCAPSTLGKDVLSDGALGRVRSEAASAEQRASFLAALALLGFSDSVRSAFAISKLLRQHGAETVTLSVAFAAILVAAISFFLCGLAGTATLLDRAHLRLVRAAMLGTQSSVRQRIGKRVLDEAAGPGRGETTKVLEAKLVAGLRCTGWFLLGGSAWIVSKVFAA